ncbi:uroporphyrinogen-III C-methyltransferase [Pseudoxanthomonas dokdonensis]|uniref:uroporphyrinogen-III C-methyltransferase n=1 Tax=Pseudoxanthomonas dokdonensis TaxID=344882 RepID=UPI0009F8D58D|nr:uroporphyrinogen-III C-methyltransferase [Pseudoxanthomonas dokdonensis]
MEIEDTTPTPRKRLGIKALTWLIVLLVLAFAGWRGWEWWQARQAAEIAKIDGTEQRMLALQSRLDSLRSEQRAQNQRLQDAAATNRVLRDEVLGLSQRGALLEESVAKLSASTAHGQRAMRLDELELLLTLANQRIVVAQDLLGARHTYALAAEVLESLQDPQLLNLRQSLAQERSALDALGKGPQAELMLQLDLLSQRLQALPRNLASDSTTPRPAWQRLLAPLVDVRPVRKDAIVAPTARNSGEAALQIELSLARAALQRGDEAGFDAALGRVQAWLPRLWPASADLAQCQQQLQQMRKAPLSAQSPVLGSTLLQLQDLRRGSPRTDLTAPITPAVPPAPTTENQP